MVENALARGVAMLALACAADGAHAATALCQPWTAALSNDRHIIARGSGATRGDAAQAAIDELNARLGTSVHVAGACAGLPHQVARNPRVLDGDRGSWEDWGRYGIDTGERDRAGRPVEVCAASRVFTAPIFFARARCMAASPQDAVAPASSSRSSASSSSSSCCSR